MVIIQFLCQVCFIRKSTQYNFRNHLKLIVADFTNVIHSQRSFRYYGAHMWNDVPAEI